MTNRKIIAIISGKRLLQRMAAADGHAPILSQRPMAAPHRRAAVIKAYAPARLDMVTDWDEAKVKVRRITMSDSKELMLKNGRAWCVERV